MNHLIGFKIQENEVLTNSGRESCNVWLQACSNSKENIATVANAQKRRSPIIIDRSDKLTGLKKVSEFLIQESFRYIFSL